jgi:glutathione S-transferase
MAEYRLYGFGESGNAYKVALMLQLSGADWELLPVDFFAGETRSAAYRDSVNAFGEAPVLLHGDLTIRQSGVILEYLADLRGRFGPLNEAERREILAWLFFDNHKFSSYTATLRFLNGLQGQDNDVTKWLRGRAVSAWHIVEKHLTAQDFMVGGRPTIADLSLAGYIYYDEQTGIAKADFPAIARWAARIAALPGWKHPYDLMPRAMKPG